MLGLTLTLWNGAVVMASDLDVQGTLTKTLMMIIDGDSKNNNALRYVMIKKIGSLRIYKYLVNKLKMDIDKNEKKHSITSLSNS